MHVVVCVDDNNGMLFNHRRQSQDRILRDYLLKITEGRELCMNAYSEGQFGEVPGIRVSEDFLREAGPEDFCFVEDQPLSALEDRIDAVILCKWNREYPGDFYLDLDLSAWTLEFSEEFSGSSHDKLTVEVYGK